MLFPSLFEGFSVGLVEGMACGLAPVASAASGAPDLIEHEKNGLLVSPRDAQGLSQAVRRLNTDRNLLHRLRLAAHHSVQELTWSRIAGDTLALYERAREFARER